MINDLVTGDLFKCHAWRGGRIVIYKNFDDPKGILVEKNDVLIYFNRKRVGSEIVHYAQHFLQFGFIYDFICEFTKL
jgi:hypothetical protein